MRQNLNRSDLFNAWRACVDAAFTSPRCRLLFFITHMRGGQTRLFGLGGWFARHGSPAANDNDQTEGVKT